MFCRYFYSILILIITTTLYSSDDNNQRAPQTDLQIILERLSSLQQDMRSNFAVVTHNQQQLHNQMDTLHKNQQNLHNQLQCLQAQNVMLIKLIGDIQRPQSTMLPPVQPMLPQPHYPTHPQQNTQAGPTIAQLHAVLERIAPVSEVKKKRSPRIPHTV